MSRERELDEFGSIFQRAVVPTIEVEKIELGEIVVLHDFSDRGPACVAAADELRHRFGSRVSHRFLLRDQDAAFEADAREKLASAGASDGEIVHGDPAAHVAQLAETDRPALIIASAPLQAHESSAAAVVAGRFIDALLVATPIPTLLMRSAWRGSVFERILAKIPGGRPDLIEQFSFAFALCRPGGQLRLLHIVDEERLKRLAEVLEITPEIDTAEGTKGVAAAAERRMEQLLRGAVRTGRGAGFHADSDIRVGDPFEILPNEVLDSTLLILGSQGSHAEFLESRAYELMNRIPNLPVLAL
ncbi:MAG: hypothetical protein V3T86_16395 [Planctomycetota bacterium]